MPRDTGGCSSCKLPGDAPGQVGGEGLEAHTGAVCPSPSLSPRQGFAPESPIHSNLPASAFLSHTLTSQAPIPWLVLPLGQPRTANESPEFHSEAQSSPGEVVQALWVGRCAGRPHLRERLDGQAWSLLQTLRWEGALEVAFQGRPLSPLPQGAGFGMS